MMQAGAILNLTGRSVTANLTAPGTLTNTVRDLNVPYDGPEEYDTPTADLLFPPVSYELVFYCKCVFTGNGLRLDWMLMLIPCKWMHMLLNNVPIREIIHVEVETLLVGLSMYSHNFGNMEI